MQRLRLKLAGISAADYLAVVCDPEPAALGRELLAVSARVQPPSDRLDIELEWAAPPPAPRTAAALAGFPLTPEVVELQAVPPARAGVAPEG